MIKTTFKRGCYKSIKINDQELNVERYIYIEDICPRAITDKPFRSKKFLFTPPYTIYCNRTNEGP